MGSARWRNDKQREIANRFPGKHNPRLWLAEWMCPAGKVTAQMETAGFTKPYPDFDIAELSRYATRNTLVDRSPRNGEEMLPIVQNVSQTPLKVCQQYGRPSPGRPATPTRDAGREYRQSQSGGASIIKSTGNCRPVPGDADVHEPIKATPARAAHGRFHDGRALAAWGERNTIAWSSSNPPSHTNHTSLHARTGWSGLTTRPEYLTRCSTRHPRFASGHTTLLPTSALWREQSTVRCRWRRTFLRTTKATSV